MRKLSHYRSYRAFAKVFLVVKTWRWPLPPEPRPKGPWNTLLLVSSLVPSFYSQGMPAVLGVTRIGKVGHRDTLTLSLVQLMDKEARGGKGRLFLWNGRQPGNSPRSPGFSAAPGKEQLPREMFKFSQIPESSQLTGLQWTVEIGEGP